MNIHQKAWYSCWLEKKRFRDKKDAYGHEMGFYITATELAGKVYDLKNGQEGWGYGRGNLGEARRFLLDQARMGKIQAHNFGRGHVSGMRFRPLGVSLTDAEKKTLEKKKNPPKKFVHFAEVTKVMLDGYELLGKKFCAKPKKMGWGRGRVAFVKRTKNIAEVTCPQCLKKMREQVKLVEGILKNKP
jgi:hypothetical protein